MDTQLDARVPFPASFPETFKNFFDMMNEDEDHAELFAHMLEDKVIPIPRPKPRKMNPQRGRCGGSLRSNSASGRSDRDDSTERSFQLQMQLQQQQQQQHRQHLQQLQNDQRGRRASISSGGEFYRETSDITEPSVHYPYLTPGRIHTLRSTHDRNAQHHNSPGLSHTGLGPMLLGPNVSSSSSGTNMQLTPGPDGGGGWGGGGGGGNAPPTSADHLRPRLAQDWQPSTPLESPQSSFHSHHNLQLEVSAAFTSGYTPPSVATAGSSSGYHHAYGPQMQVPARSGSIRRQLPVNGASSVAVAIDAFGRMELDEEERRSCTERIFDVAFSWISMCVCADAECTKATDRYDVPTPACRPEQSYSNGQNRPLYEMERAGVGHQRMLPIPPVSSRHSGGLRSRPIVQAWVQEENDRNLIRSAAVPVVHTQSRHADPRNIESVGAVQDWQHLRNIDAPPPRYEEYMFAAQHAGGSRQDLRRGSAAEPNMQHSVRHYMAQEVHPRSLHSVEHSREHAEVSRVLTIQQAMCGAVSPQYGTVVDHPPPSYSEARAITGVVAVNEMSSGLGASGSVPVEAGCSTPKRARQVHIEREPPIGEAAASPARGQRHNSSGTLLVPGLSNRVAPRQRRRTSSMPAECPRVSISLIAVLKASSLPLLPLSSSPPSLPSASLSSSAFSQPQHAEVRQAVKHAEDQGMEYYRLRSFSITSNGVCNLGDSLRCRRSRSNNSVTSGGTSYSGNRYHNRNASGNIIERTLSQQTLSGEPPTFKIAMLGSPAVGKSALSFQFTTSDHICGYDLSLEMEYGQKTVSVLVDDVESDIEVVDHPACEMSTEAFCATYDIDLFVVVYSVLDVYSFRNAERVLHYLRENDMLLSRGAILVGNKVDLERHRAVPQEMGHKVATEISCKFIETSAGLCHNVNELLVGVVAQVKLNPQRLSMLSPADLERVNMQSSIQNHRRMHLERQLSMCHSDHGLAPDAEDDPNRPHISLRDILNVGESDLEDSEETEAQRRHRLMTRFEFLAANIRNESVRPISPVGKRCSIGTATSDNKVARLQRRAMDDSHLGRRVWARPECRKHLFLFNCNGRVKKMTARTKTFVSSLLRFKASHWLSRRTSSSCTDLFAI
ncbi:uncharacterized protein LOC108156219 [Drosophila miranda]|uniref:uncharacterized protein LOC108156219 n=1 Tax=Drosophila miranda TaxID=7229 RepID=UPI00143F0CA0|nr:uncharacterized protein LOC108156219 [Drosophila miranda]